MSSTQDYLMGASNAELERLTIQAGLLEPVTRRLIRQAGIGPGMSVLDVGCGVGDVALLVAEAVGSSGRVVAIDREERALARARSRPVPSGAGPIEFIRMTDDEFGAFTPFDAAIGRYVLFHQPDPVAMLRRVASAVRPGGIVAFEERVVFEERLVAAESSAIPPLGLWTHLVKTCQFALRAGLPSPDVGGRLVSVFEDAGLSTPALFWEGIVGGPDSPIIPWAIRTYQSILPMMEHAGLPRPDLGDLTTLEDRLIAAARAARTQFVGSTEACAWGVRR